MQAWLIDKLGSITNLHLGEIPEPAPGPHEVVLRMIYAALNPADRYLAEGQYPARPQFPHVLGRDGVGRVMAVGAAVTRWRIGDTAVMLRGPVGVTAPGTFSRLTAVSADSLTDVPPGWSLEQAAGAALTYMTAWQSLTQWGGLHIPQDPLFAADAAATPEESAKRPPVVLVTGASGGVGVAAVQLASAMEYTVAAFSRSPEKRRALLDLGAAVVLDPADSQWRKVLLQKLDGRRVDLVVDNIGGPQFTELLDVMAAWGKISVVGRLAGPVPNLNTASLFFRRLRIGGVAVGDYSRPQAAAVWQNALALLAKTGQRPQIDRIFEFSELPAAFDRLAAGPLGKVLLRVGA